MRELFRPDAHQQAMELANGPSQPLGAHSRDRFDSLRTTPLADRFAIAAGCAECLTKPYELADLIALVERYIGPAQPQTNTA